MPICIECCYPVSHLYTSYSRADDRSLGKGVRLTQCPRCQRFADKYVEHDFVVLFIDLVLIKPQVYRHLLFNRLGRDDDKLDRSIIRLGVLTLLFDVYLSWASVEKSGTIASSSLATAHILIQYLFFLTLNTLGTLAHHATVRVLAVFLVPWPSKANDRVNNYNNDNNDIPTISGNASPSGIATPVPTAQSQSQTATPTAGNASPTNLTRASSMGDLGQSGYNLSTATLPIPGADSLHPPLRRVSTAPIPIDPIPPPAPASANAISTALLVSSCTKLFPLLLVIWASDSSDAAQDNASRQVSTAVTTSTTSLAGKLLTAATTSGSLTASPTSWSLPPSPASSSSSSSMSAASPQASDPSFSTSNTWTSSPAVQPILSLLFSATPTHLVVLNNIEAVFILLDCGYVRAAAIALGGQLARWLIQKAILSTVGL